MNSTSLVRTIGISTLSLAAVLAAAPLAAFAQDANVTADTSVNVAAPTHVMGVRGAYRMNGDASTSPRGAMRAHMGSASTTADMMQKEDARSNTEIDARVKSLGDLSTHIENMKLLPAASITSITASIQAEIDKLTALKAKIATDTDPATLKADMQSIADAYRVYLLVIPQDRITAASSRIVAVAAQMQTLSTKLAARIAADTSASSAVIAAKTDFDAKVADASVQANAAVALVTSLTPDNGNATVKSSNTAALKSAMTKIQAGQADLKAARADAEIIVKGVAGKGKKEGAASTTATTGASTGY